MKLQNEYDWAVIGDHPAALLSGCIAARLGYSVLLLPYSPGLGARVVGQNQVFDPESSFFTGWIQQPQKLSFFQSLLLWLAGDSDHPLLSGTVSTRTQLLTRTLRADLQDSLDQLSRSLLETTEYANISSFFRQRLSSLSSVLSVSSSVSPDLFVSEDWNEKVSTLLEGHRVSKRRYLKTFNRRDVVSVLKRKTEFQNELLVDLIQSVEKDSSGMLSGENALQTLFRVFFLEHQGVAIPGGIRTLHRLLENISKRWGVQKANVYQIERMFIDKDRFVGFQMKDESERGRLVSVKGGILGCSLDHARPLIVDESQKRSPLRKSPEPLGWRYTLSLRVSRMGIPLGLGRRALWVEPGAPHLEIEVVDPLVYSLTGTPAAASSKKDDTCFVFLRTVLPFKQFSLDRTYQRKIASRMLQVACDQFPFFASHMKEVFPNENTVPEQDPYAFSNVSMIPENLRVIDQHGVGSQSGIANLYLATGESYPELGSFGAYLSGIQSVSRFYKALLPKTAV